MRRRSLEWEAHGVPALPRAMFQPAPFLADLDGWMLVRRTQGSVETGGGAGCSGPRPGPALATLTRLASPLRANAALSQSSRVLDRIGGRATIDHVTLRLVQVALALLLLVGIAAGRFWRQVSGTLRAPEQAP